MILPNNIIERIALKDEYFDLRGLSIYSKLSVSTLREHIRMGNLPAYKVRGKILVKRSIFDTWMDRKNRFEGKLKEIADQAMQAVSKG